MDMMIGDGEMIRATDRIEHPTICAKNTTVTIRGSQSEENDIVSTSLYDDTSVPAIVRVTTRQESPPSKLHPVNQ